jgi:16S rRNA A1518/A1519 N6-dimethyltransferase RsmA/KsgA/DIM1 with predicted DNA glycosylase/AP lyase activity
VTRKFARAVGPLDGCHVIEVGPGPGSLTRALAEDGLGTPARLTVVEKDSRFLPFLEQLSETVPCKMDVVHGDILRFDYSTVLSETTGPVRIVGNLPFGIATPLLMG